MDDAAYITNATRNGAEDAKKIVSEFTASLSNISSILHGNQSALAAITNLINAFANMASLTKKGKK
jgi:hypothetical protein